MRVIDEDVGKRLLKGVDLACIWGVSFSASVLFSTNANAHTPALAGFFALTLTFLSLYLLRGLGLYETKSLSHVFRNICLSITSIVIAGFAFSILIGIAGLELSKQWHLVWAIFCVIYFTTSRSALLPFIARREKAGSFKQRIAIVGGGKAAEDAINTLERSKDLDVEIVGLFDDRYDNRSPSSIRKHQKLGKITDLANFARINPIDLIIVAIPISAEQRLLQILKRIWELPIDIRVSGQSAQLKLSPRAYTYLGDLPLLSVFDRPLSPWNDFLKSNVDRLIAVCAIIVLAPVMAAVAVAVRWESKGPIIFKQKRFGFNNELIEVYKFRSMFTDMSDASASKLVTKGDPRVTKVGRIIRKTSLDELPQLFNVLTGQLALVGPRPHATQAKAAGGLYDEVVDGYFARHKVKPGITGWAQINGWRGETDTVEKIEQRVKHDLDYIDRWSMALDLYILAKTPFALLKSENAY
jgi:Undecaprenyl-phosphate glucose phosphotransferase